MGIDVPTVLDALRADPAGYDVSYAQGCPVLGGDDEGIGKRTAVVSWQGFGNPIIVGED